MMVASSYILTHFAAPPSPQKKKTKKNNILAEPVYVKEWITFHFPIVGKYLNDCGQASPVDIAQAIP